MKALLWCWTISCALAGVSALRLVTSHFPSHVIRGGRMNLTCDYDPEGDRIYQVKWYKDDHEFYTYAPGKSAKTFDNSGLDVNNIDLTLSDAKSVVIVSVDLPMEGKYGCEVTVDLSFDTVIATGKVKVVELPQSGPVVTGVYMDSMEEGDDVQVNCTTYRSRPAPTLTWYINEARSDNASLTVYPERVEPSGLRTVTLGLDFRLRGVHFGPAGQLTLKCTAEIESVFYRSADVRITSRTMAMRSRHSSASALGSHHVAISLLLILLSLRCPPGG